MKQKTLAVIVGFMEVYSNSHNLLLNQKIGQELDHDSITNNLKNLLNDINDYKKDNESNLKNTKFLPELLDAIYYATVLLLEISKGLGDKANNRQKYGFLKYRNDRKEYNKLRKHYSLIANIFKRTHS